MENNLLKSNGKVFCGIISGFETFGIIAVKDNLVYLCQDKINGAEIDYKYGFKYSWAVESGSSLDLRDNAVIDFHIQESFDSIGIYKIIKEKSIVNIGKSRKNYIVFLINSNDKCWLRRGKEAPIGPYNKSDLKLSLSFYDKNEKQKKRGLHKSDLDGLTHEKLIEQIKMLINDI